MAAANGSDAPPAAVVILVGILTKLTTAADDIIARNPPQGKIRKQIVNLPSLTFSVEGNAPRKAIRGREINRRMSDSAWSAVVLAGGQGTRMKSALPKVMHAIGGRPMLAHVL